MHQIVMSPDPEGTVPESGALGRNNHHDRGVLTQEGSVKAPNCGRSTNNQLLYILLVLYNGGGYLS